MGSLNIPYSPMVWCQFWFFMMQPVAITIEDLAIYLGRRVGLKMNCECPRSLPRHLLEGQADCVAGMTKAIGYAWVGCVLSFTLRYAIKGFMDAGLGSSKHPFVEKFGVMERVFA
jgi:hypothetical protein